MHSVITLISHNKISNFKWNGSFENSIIWPNICNPSGAYNQLLDEDNLAGRVGVIAGGATLGLLVGLLRSIYSIT